MKRLLFFIGFMTLGTAALFKLLTVTTPTGGPGQPVDEAPQVANVLSLDGVRVIQREGQGMTWELRAATATYNEETQTGLLEQVRFEVVDPSGAPDLSGQSSSAFMDARSNDLVLMGGVVLTHGPGVEIRSERLEYDGSRDEIVSPGPVRVRTPQGLQQGDALRFSLPEDRLEFTRPRFEH